MSSSLYPRSFPLILVLVYFTTASQRPPKEIKIDFFYMHTVTSSIFLSKFLSLPFLDLESKLRLAEWKGRMDLIMYVSRGTPKLSLDDIVHHQAKRNWETIFAESAKHPRDDGHLPKLERAVAFGQRVCQPYEDRAKDIGLVITGDMWLKIGNLGMESSLLSVVFVSFGFFPFASGIFSFFIGNFLLIVIVTCIQCWTRLLTMMIVRYGCVRRASTRRGRSMWIGRGRE